MNWIQTWFDWLITAIQFVFIVFGVVMLLQTLLMAIRLFLYKEVLVFLDQTRMELKKGDRVAVCFQPGLVDCFVLDTSETETEFGTISVVITLPVITNRPTANIIKTWKQVGSGHPEA